MLGGGILIAVVPISPGYAGPPFRTEDSEPVEYQHLEINNFSEGTQTAGGWEGILPGVELNYGALPDLQLRLIVPQNYSAPVDGRTAFALGDLELGVKYRFITPGEDDWYPQVAVFPLIEMPSGNQKFEFGTGHTQVFLPLWLQKDFAPWTVYGGGGYWINPGVDNKNYSFFGAALWRAITEQFKVGVEVFHQTSSANDVKESTGFNVGATYDFAPNWRLLTSVGSGVQNQSETNRFSYYLGLQLTL
jgi:hypothetical protein